MQENTGATPAVEKAITVIRILAKNEKVCNSRSPLCKQQTCQVCFQNSFAASAKSKYWSEKNGELKPWHIHCSRVEKIWMKCDKCPHHFHIAPVRISSGRWCPYCPGRSLCDDADCMICFNRSFASHPKAHTWSKKNKISARQVSKLTSTPKRIFNCDVCGHEHIKAPGSFDNANCDYRCVYCTNRSTLMCGIKECEFCFNRSIASTKYAKLWSKKNHNINLWQIHKWDPTKYWYNCKKCQHAILTTIVSVERDGNTFCKYCDGISKLYCGDKNCQQCYEKSFATHPKSKYWSSKNDTNTWEITPYSSTQGIFDCDICGHEFKAAIGSIFQGGWCKYCHISLCDKVDCIICFNKSFASCPKSKYWTKNNDKQPRDLRKYSLYEAEFSCEMGHVFRSDLQRISHGGWCNECCPNNKTEYKLRKYLESRQIVSVSQAKYDWCRSLITNRQLIYDFVLDELKIIIELDGDQHFSVIPFFQTDPEEQRRNDLFKMKKAVENLEYTFIRIFQPMVWYDTENWEDLLSMQLYKRDIPELVYISSNDCYKDFPKTIDELKK